MFSPGIGWWIYVPMKGLNLFWDLLCIREFEKKLERKNNRTDVAE
jgi:hypothetical protein